MSDKVDHGKFIGDEDEAQAIMDWIDKQELADNAFCPTGPGGGQDNSCPPARALGSDKQSALHDTAAFVQEHLNDHGFTGRQLRGHELATLVTDTEKYLRDHPDELAALEHRCMTETCKETQERYTVNLYDKDHVSMYLLRWGPGQEAEWHDHGDASNGAKVGIRILKGPVENDVLTSDGRVLRETLHEGKSYVLPSHYTHRVATASDKATWSLHAYSSPTDGLDKMNFYKFDEHKNPILDGAHQPIKISQWEKEPVATQNVKRDLPADDLDRDDGAQEYNPKTGKLTPVPKRLIARPETTAISQGEVKQRKKVFLN